MRITKKFAGSSCIGKQVCAAVDGAIDENKRKQVQDELKALEETFMAKVEYLHKLNHPPNPVPLVGRISMDGGHHMLQHPAHANGYPAVYYPCHMPLPVPPLSQSHHLSGNMSSSTSSESHASPRSHTVPRNSYPLVHMREIHYRGPGPSQGDGSGSGSGSGSSSGFDTNNHNSHNSQQILRRSLHNHSGAPSEGSTSNGYRQGHSQNQSQSQSQSQSQNPKVLSNAPAYRPRQAHTSADLFGRQYPTTIEQMTFLSSENLRKKLAADNTMPSNGFHSGGRMGMGDAAKFCSAAAHAYSDKVQDDSAVNKVKVEYHSASLAALTSSDSSKSLASESSSSSDKRKEIKQVDLEASDLLLNFFNAAGSSSSSSRKDGSTCGSSGSGSTSNQGEQDGDDSVSTFSDAMDADVSASTSGRSSSLSSDRSDNNSDIDYSSPDDNECNTPPPEIFFPTKLKIEASYNNSTGESFEDNFVAKKQRIN